MEYRNHYVLGSFEVSHDNKTLVVGNGEELSDYIDTLQKSNFEVAYVPAGMEHRPDLISYAFYGTVTKDWLIMMYNNLSDPFQSLNVGDRILIPVL